MLYLPAEFSYIPLAEQVFPIHSPCTGNCGIGNARASKSCEMLKLYENERQITANICETKASQGCNTAVNNAGSFAIFIYISVYWVGWLLF